jgi:hypothetical protein
MPEGFGWVDHRLARKGYLRGRSREALALYLFLVVVADADGVSYYSEESLCGHLDFSCTELSSSREELCNAELVAYRRPFYQVLDLPPTSEEKENFNKVLGAACVNKAVSPDADQACSLGDIIKSMTGGLKNDRL